MRKPPAHITRYGLTTEEVAAILRKSTEWFYRNRDRLIRECGFPQPLRGLGTIWDNKAIEAWMDAQSGLNATQSNPQASWQETLQLRISTASAPPVLPRPAKTARHGFGAQ